MSKKQVSVPNFLQFSWLKDEKFKGMRNLLQHQHLHTFLEMTGKVYPQLIKVFYTNLTFEGVVLKSQVKVVDIEVTSHVWNDLIA